MTLHRRPFAAGNVVALVVASIALAQCPAPAWISMSDLPGIDGNALASTVWDPDGAGPAASRLVVGGAFAVAGGVQASRIATFDGVSWSAVGTGMDATVRALCVYNGEIIAGGDFTTAGGVAASSIAKWDGSSWHPLGLGINGVVKSLAVWNGLLVAGGTFISAGGVTAFHVAAWDGTAWSPLGLGISSPLLCQVLTLAAWNGDLVAGGCFQSAGGQQVNGVARWDGSTWHPLGSGTSGEFFGPSAFAVWNGDLVAGGNFGSIGGVPVQYVARWDGTAWQSMNTGMDAPVWSLCVFNGALVAAGSFTQAGGTSAGRVASHDGSSWQPVGAGFPSGASILTLAAFNGDLVAGGGNQNGLARWDGTSWKSVGPGGTDGAVNAMTTFGDDLVVAGAFSQSNGGVATPRIGRWDGANWQSFGPGLPGTMNALTTWSGLLVAGGTHVSGTTVSGTVDLWTGAAWQSLASLPGSGVNALTTFNGDLVAGGWRYASGDSLVRWNGSSWQSMTTGVFFYGNGAQVHAMTVFNGELIVGGLFDTIEGVPVASIARFDGTTWHPLGTGVSNQGWPGEVLALTVYGGELVAGGNFTIAGGMPANAVARWNGTSWQPFGTGLTDNYGDAKFVWALAVSNGDLVAGGDFVYAGAVPVNGSARWDGTSWQPMGSGAIHGPTPGHVRALASYKGATIVGGTFTTPGGFASPYLAAWTAPLPLLTFSQPGGPGAGIVVRNAWLVPGHEYYNLASLDLSPGGVGTGPYGGLTFLDPSVLIAQVLLPVNTSPFHFMATGTTATLGTYSLAAGTTFEAISVDVTGGMLGCLAPALRYTVQ
jgi:hypothetical protein